VSEVPEISTWLSGESLFSRHLGYLLQNSQALQYSPSCGAGM
jgi:hypothetical protein